MMVIRGVPSADTYSNSDAPSSTANPTLLSVTNNYLFPADRCTWTQVATTTGGYDIEDAVFWPGVGVHIDGQGTPTTANDGIRINNAELGYIGKSGRFVQITSS